MTTEPTPRSEVSRRRVLRTGALVTSASLLGVAATGTATAAKGMPDFDSGIWGDGEQWGTKVTGEIKNPNENSLDEFFVVTNGVQDQTPVSVAAPGNPDYNGGRWWTHTVTWEQGIAPTLLRRYGPATETDSIQYHYDEGHLEIEEGSPAGGPPAYFRCPLLPFENE